MADTVLKPSFEQRRWLATGYDPDGQVAPYMDQGALQGAGSMFSTLADLLFKAKHERHARSKHDFANPGLSPTLS